MNKELELYTKIVLPWRQRAEQAEALCDQMGIMIKHLSAEVCKEGK